MQRCARNLQCFSALLGDYVFGRNVLFGAMRKRFRRPKALQDCCHQDGAFRLAEGDFERRSSVYSRCGGCWPALCLPDIDLVLVFIHGATFPRIVCSCFSSIASSILYSSEHADRRWLVYLPRRCWLISAKSLEHKLSSCFDETVACGRAFAPGRVCERFFGFSAEKRAER